MSPELIAYVLVAALAASVAGLLVALRRRSARALWMAAGIHVAVGLAAQSIERGIPLYAVFRRVCPYGFYLDGYCFAVGVLLASAYVHRTAVRGGTLRTVIFAAGLCWAIFSAGLGFWIA